MTRIPLSKGTFTTYRDLVNWTRGKPLLDEQHPG